jgi:hypothetical protein
MINPRNPTTMTGSPMPSSMALPSVPPGESPETYQIGPVTRLLKSAAFLPIFSIHDPSKINTPLPSPRSPDRIIGILVNEQLHRFEYGDALPEEKEGLTATNRFGEPLASVHIRWMVIPDDFVAAPGLTPPPTELDPTRSQRFTMLDGQLTFNDPDQSGIHGFGAGQTFPVMVAGQPQLRIGAVVNVLDAFGKLSGLQGLIVVNGYIQPPQSLFLNFVARFMDPRGRLRARSPISPLQVKANPDPGTTFLVFEGELDPARPVTLNRGPDGRITGSNVHERLRLVDPTFDLSTAEGLRGRTEEGPVVGRLQATTLFDPTSPLNPIPFQTRDGLLTFYDRGGGEIGTLRANLVEGRAFPTSIEYAPMPVFRVGGFGPFIEGTGQFRGVIGMLSLNAVISVFPRTLSMLYVLRISDPDGRFRAACRDAWSS